MDEATLDAINSAILKSTHSPDCDCGTRQGWARRHWTDTENVELVCCIRCHRVDFEKRWRIELDGIVCVECVPRNAFERLEVRRGHKYGVGESPDADIAELLDIVEESERFEREHGALIETEHDLARAIFAVAMSDEVKRRAEAPRPVTSLSESARATLHRMLIRKTLDVMWMDAAYAKDRDDAVTHAALVWAARRLAP
jgi:hypothetical protein